MSYITKRTKLDIIKSMPDIYLNQFFKISAYFQGYKPISINRQKAAQNKSVFINESEQALKMLHILTAIVSTGGNIEDQVYMDEDKANESNNAALEFFSVNTDKDVKIDTAEIEEAPKDKKTKTTSTKSKKK